MNKLHYLCYFIICMTCLLFVACETGTTARQGELDTKCYEEIVASIHANDLVSLMVLADLEAGDINRAKSRLTTTLLVSMATMPQMLNRADNPEELKSKLEKYSTQLLTYLNGYLPANPDEADLVMTQYGLAGLKKLVEDAEAQRQLSALIIRLYGTDEMEVPFYMQ